MRAWKQIINGKSVAAKSGKTISVEDPSTREVLGSVPQSGRADVDAAVAAAAAAFPAWSATTPAERALALLKLADALESAKRKFVKAESENAGKPISAVGIEVDAVVDNLRYFAGAGRNMEGKAVAEYLPGRTSMIRRDPVGVVASIAPWNYPLLMAGWKIGPALVTGNTVVLKPSARTPITALMLGALAQEFLPAGVLNVITGTGDEAGAYLAQHPGVGMVSVTGDTATGKRIAAAGAATVKRLHLELGGKAPVLVFDDADVDLVASTMRAASFWNAGQDCTAACRIIAGPKIYERLVDALIKQARKLPCELYKSLTWDRGSEMSNHKRFTLATEIQVYFCDHKSPWQRGSNENTNRLIRDYLPKYTDLSLYSQSQLNAIARELNERPRKTLEYETPAARFNACVASTGWDRTYFET